MQFVTSRSEALDKLNKYLESDVANYNTKEILTLVLLIDIMFLVYHLI